MTILYWAFVAWWILAPVAGPWDGEPAFIPGGYALQTLLLAALIYFFIMGLFWTLFGFYDDRPYIDDGPYYAGPRRRTRYED